jgi:hypothetical protein
MAPTLRMHFGTVSCAARTRGTCGADLPSLSQLSEAIGVLSTRPISSAVFWPFWQVDTAIVQELPIMFGFNQLSVVQVLILLADCWSILGDPL